MSEYGLGDLGATLASRIHGSTELVMVNSKVNGVANCLLVEVPTNSSDSYSYYVVGKFPGHPHFPYGYSVAADAPV